MRKTIIYILVAVAVLSIGIVLFVRLRSLQSNPMKDIPPMTDVAILPDSDGGAVNNKPICGNGDCSDGEDSTNCPGDCPTITRPKHKSGASTDSIVWGSDFPTKATIEYGTTNDLDELEESAEISELGTSHEFIFGDLEPNTVYNYRLTVSDEAGNVIQVIDDEFRTSAE